MHLDLRIFRSFDWKQEEKHFFAVQVFIQCAYFHRADTVKVTKMASPFIQDPVDEQAALICRYFLGHIHMHIYLNGTIFKW